MSVMASLVKEGYPTTGLYQCFNGSISFGGFEIIRIENATFTVTNNPDIYFEVGRREGTTYTKEFDVRGSLRRAYINGVEWKLAVGFPALKRVTDIKGKEVIFHPGKEYTDLDEGATLLSPNDFSFDNSFVTGNVYPIKTVGTFDINTKDGIPMEGGSPDAPTRYKMFADITGIMIDALSVNIGQSGDLIMSGPINWIGENVKFGVEEIPFV